MMIERLNAYTLIEILIALAIFSILSLLGGHVLIESNQTKKQLLNRTKSLEALEVTLALLRQDTQEIIDRSIRTDKKTLIPGFSGKKSSLRFVKNSSTLSKVAWFCKDHALIRATWTVIDDPKHQAPLEKIMLPDVLNCEFHYIGPDHQRHSNWAPHPSMLPHAIELTLTLTHFGKNDFLFMIPGSTSYAS